MPEHLVFSTERFAPSDHGDVRFEELFDYEGLHAAHIVAPDERASELGAAHHVTGVYPNAEFHIHTAPPDFETEITTDNVVSDDDIRQVHGIPDDLDATGDGLSVVVMDSGRDASQFDTDEEIPQTDMTGTGDNTDDVGHGTSTMGLVHELAPDAALHALRIFGSKGTTSGNVILRGYQWLLNHASEIDMVNMSWGGSQDIPEIDTLHEKLMSKGVLCVVSAGNSGGASGSPAVAQNAFSVGAITLDGSLTSFSSYNPPENPDVCALGKNNLLLRSSDGDMGTPVSVADDGTVSPDENGDHVVASGTSFSAPICSGLSCLLLTTDGVDVALSDVPQTEDESSTDIPGTNHDGNGIVKLGAAIDAARPPGPDTPDTPDEPGDGTKNGSGGSSNGGGDGSGDSPPDNESERYFEGWFADELRAAYGTENVHEQYIFADQRRCDILVETPAADECYELENDSASTVNGSGQARHYMQARVDEVNGDRNVRAILAVPAGHVDTEEKRLFRKSGIEVREIGVPEHVSIKGV